MNKRNTSREPATAHKTAEARNALDLYLSCGNPFSQLNFGRRAMGMCFDAPTPEEEKAAADAKAAERAALAEEIEKKLEEKNAKRFDAMNAEIRRLREPKGKKIPADPDDTETPPDPKTVKEIADQIAADRREAEQEKIEAAQERVLNSLKLADGNEDHASAYLDKLTRGKLAYDKASKAVVVNTRDELGTAVQVPYAAFVEELNKAGKFKLYQPPLETPPNDGGKRGNAGSAGGNKTFSADDLRLGRVSRDTLRKG